MADSDETTTATRSTRERRLANTRSMEVAQRAEQAVQVSEQAVTLFVDSALRAARLWIPPVLLNPLAAADLTFDLAQQALAAARQLSHDVLDVVKVELPELAPAQAA